MDKAPSLILPVMIWLLCIIGTIALVAAVSGCTTVDGVCAVQPAGQDENGIAYFRYRCVPA